MAHAPGTAQVDANDRVEILDAHVEDHPVAQDAGIVDDDVNVAPLLDGGLDHPLGAIEVRDVVAIGQGFTARGADLVDDFARWTTGRPAAVQLGADVVDDYACAVAREF